MSQPPPKKTILLKDTGQYKKPVKPIKPIIWAPQLGQYTFLLEMVYLPRSAF